ncbi:MAG: hypothetical protein JWN25_794 [Verrucomicrobiales bacterium]|nr:hypothetical protein [Verrucomicrobiales bacterium]
MNRLSLFKQTLEECLKRLKPSSESQTLRSIEKQLEYLIWGVMLCCFFSAAPSHAAEPGAIPVGLDAYRNWEQWPVQRIGVRAYMRSTYDRTGGNESADASHFLYQLADDNNVTLDVQGAGILYFSRYNHWHGSPWRYTVDGAEHILKESSTADPNKPVADSIFLPENLLPAPLAYTWSSTKGADLIWVPISFQDSFRMAYSRTRYGTGYYIYHQFINGTKLSQSIKTWDGKTPPSSDVLELINRSGSDISPSGIDVISGLVDHLAFNESKLLLYLTNAPSTLRKLSFSVPREEAIAFGSARLRITWDDRELPSVEAPIALFFGAGTLYNRDEREFLVKAFPSFIRFHDGKVELSCFFPMPFFKSAKIELIGSKEKSLENVMWTVARQPSLESPARVGYFHATYFDFPHPEPGKDIVLLDTRNTEGSRNWSGSFIGNSWIFSDRANLTTLEGDPRFFFDDSQSPQAYGTGTEEWGGGGDYWGGLNMTLPFAGHPVGARNPKEAKNQEDMIQSAYRFLLADLMPFGKNAVIRLEHGGINESTEHYQTVTYWYGAPAASLVKTDELKVGNIPSETAHHYLSPQASPPYEIKSRYELGPDTIGAGGSAAVSATPADYAEFEFNAVPNKKYYIWVHGKNLDGNNMTDASWLQFDQDIGTTHLAPTYSHPMGFGNWLDRFPAGTYAWSSALPQDPPQTVIFSKEGRHTLRVQPRQPVHYIDQIWLSTTQTNLPPVNTRPTPGPNDIVLNPVDATDLHGKIRRIADKEAALGVTLEINGTNARSTVIPVETDSGRKTIGTSEFTLKLDPSNLGVMLRRKLDYSFPNQRAEVYIAPDENRAAANEWKPAGVWYLAGGNTCVFSNPKEELGATQHTAQTSNRRFRDDEFLLPLNLTKGQSSIRVRIKFVPVNIPLFPGRPLDELAWSEIRYDAYCFITPNWNPLQKQPNNPRAQK